MSTSSQPGLQEMVASARTILDELLRHLELADVRVAQHVEDGQLFFQIETADADLLIGRTSQTLDAIQFLLNRLLSRQFEDSPYCVVDVDHYRARRREKLLADVQEALERVRRTGQPWRMPLLNSMERRMVHQALKDCPDIQTQSEDETPDGRKRVVISLRETEPAPAEDMAADSPASGVHDGVHD